MYVLYPNEWVDGIDKVENYEALEWIATRMKELFIADNGLIREKHGKGAAAMDFSRILYYDDLEYYVDGYKKPDNINAEDYISPLVYNVNYRPLEAGYDVYRQRDGKKFERISGAPVIGIELPNADGSYMFIRIEADNYISYCAHGPNWVDSQCMYYGAEFEDETLNAYDVIHTFLEAIKSEKLP